MLLVGLLAGSFCALLGGLYSGLVYGLSGLPLVGLFSVLLGVLFVGLLFGLFIVACGGTHFMEVYTLWHPRYWLSGNIKLLTAAASVAECNCWRATHTNGCHHNAALTRSANRRQNGSRAARCASSCASITSCCSAVNV